MAAWDEGFDLPHQPHPVQIPALPAPDSAVNDDARRETRTSRDALAGSAESTRYLPGRPG
jgi:hypothetical protein